MKYGRATINPNSPQAVGICDGCGFLYDLRALRWQWDWRGTAMASRHMRVCSTCYDRPQEQLRAIILPPDPPPVRDPRIEPYDVDEFNSYTLSAILGKPGMFADVCGMVSGLLAIRGLTGTVDGACDVLGALKLAAILAASVEGVSNLTAVLELVLASLVSLNIQSFTADGTYTPSAGMAFALAIATGGGAGSGGAATQAFVALGATAAAGAGGGGATCVELFTAAQIGASQAVDIGAGGTAGANTGTAGGNGGATTLGALLSAGGGLGGSGTGNVADGGAVYAAAGAGGTATGGLINVPGGGGATSFNVNSTSADTHGAAGGSFWGQHSAALLTFANAANYVNAGVAGSGFGVGAIGAFINQISSTQTDQAGAVGSDGYMMIIEFLTV